ncbi:hypothetical protein [Pseudomonas sp. S2_A02]|jgi:hypothetical protein
MSDLIFYSPTWRLHFKPYVNGNRVKWGEVTLNLVAGQRCELKLDYEDSTFIGDPDAFLALEYQEGVEGQGLVFDPPLGQYCEMAEGTTSLNWSIFTDQAPSGPFGLKFKFPIGSTLPDSPLLPGEIVNIAQEVDVIFDEFPVTFETSTAYPCHGATHTFTVRPKPSSYFLNKEVKLLWGGKSAESLGVVITPALENVRQLTVEGLTWEVNCLSTTEDGDFSLQLGLVDSWVVSSPLTMSLGHNLLTAERWQTSHHQWPDIEWTSYHIRVKSAFTEKVISGVKVILEYPGGEENKRTDAKGEFATTISQQSIRRLKVYNPYNKDYV